MVLMTASSGSADATPAPAVSDNANAPAATVSPFNDSLMFGHLPSYCTANKTSTASAQRVAVFGQG
ncbi:hypothetical protein I547_3749 [Mycobacterium kansasii 824]|uniref:Uncharacterized protein n=1 Tax=Mycobacterium kansasii TaxID=1768 RepID=A0A1V3XJH7_MYCKA|nr:hypothetical protein I547_3749 [Mycobacterium kansasii 824]OOK79355.1 hypothetical protein BZL30_2396 [Mycobacterium kansasii]